MRLRKALPAFVLLGAVAWILIMGKSIVIDESFLRRQLRAVPHVLEQRWQPSPTTVRTVASDYEQSTQGSPVAANDTASAATGSDTTQPHPNNTALPSTTTLSASNASATPSPARSGASRRNGTSGEYDSATPAPDLSGASKFDKAGRGLSRLTSKPPTVEADIKTSNGFERQARVASQHSGPAADIKTSKPDIKTAGLPLTSKPPKERQARVASQHSVGAGWEKAGNDSMGDVAVVSNPTQYATLEAAQALAVNHKLYAARWGFAYKTAKDCVRACNLSPGAWTKVAVLIEMLEKHAWALWMDGDSAVVDMEHDLRPWMRRMIAEDKFLAVRENHYDRVTWRNDSPVGMGGPIVNSGVLLLRRGPESGDFLGELMHMFHTQSNVKHHGWWEQFGINILLSRHSVARGVWVMHGKDAQEINGLMAFHGELAAHSFVAHNVNCRGQDNGRSHDLCSRQLQALACCGLASLSREHRMAHEADVHAACPAPKRLFDISALQGTVYQRIAPLKCAERWA
jgi:hypothetical protein